MHKLRNNLFYFCALLGFIGWIVNTVAVMGICGVTHPILLRDLFILGIQIFVFYFYAHRGFDDVETPSFNLRRAVVTKGDVLVLRFLGPWMLLLFQIAITAAMLAFAYEKFYPIERPQAACEYRSRRY